MKLAKVILLVLGAIIVLIAGVAIAAGLMVPAERSFSNEIEIKAPAEVVWAVINDRERYTEWQPSLTRVEIVDDRHWVEFPKDSPEPLRFSLANDDRPTKMEFDYTMGDSFGGKWRGEITPTADGVKLKTVDSYEASGRITRILIFAFFDMDKFAKEWNEKLKQRAESLDH